MDPTKKELLLAGLIMLTLAMTAECVLRLAGFSYDPQLYIADQDKGWALRPLAEGTVTGEARQMVRINSHGFRDRERSYTKPSDTVRFAVLGNSWTEALQVPLEKTYCSLLERKLAECSCFAGRRVEVLNFGVSGYSTAQELLVLRDNVRKYHPDFVLVAFYSARDVANNLRAFNNAANPEQSPYYVYRGETLVLDSSFRNLPVVQKRQIMLQQIRIWVNEHFRVLQAINALVRAGRTRVAMAGVQQRDGKEGVKTLEHAIYAEPSQEALREAWRVTEGLLVALREEAKLQGADFRIVSLANRPQVIPDRSKRLAFMQTLGVDNLSYADDRIQALGRREGIPVSTLAPILAAYAEEHRIYLNGFDASNLGGGHWNETGHRLAAETIAGDVCRSARSERPQALASTR